MTEQDIEQIKLIIQAEAENHACLFGNGPEDLPHKLQYITNHYNKLESFLNNNGQ
jgi:hypothetical protein